MPVGGKAVVVRSTACDCVACSLDAMLGAFGCCEGKLMAQRLVTQKGLILRVLLREDDALLEQVTNALHQGEQGCRFLKTRGPRLSRRILE